MEQILSTVSKATSEVLTEIEATFNLSTSFEKSQEQVGDDFLQLNPVSVDEVEFLDSKKIKNGVEGIECELLVNHSKDVNFEIDIDGTLHISDYNPEKYSINEQGELILQL